jgi:hypothetical protein
LPPPIYLQLGVPTKYICPSFCQLIIPAFQYWVGKNPFKKVHGSFSKPIRQKDWMWFRGDRVEVLVGEDKGKQGYINFVVQVEANF